MGPPVVVQADALAKAYGGNHLFDDVAFIIHQREKVAVVGPNGAGKSTLLRILAGRERADHGTLRTKDGLRTHWFDQHPVIPPAATVREILAAPTAAPAHLQAELDALEARIADPKLYETPGYERVIERYGALQQEVSRATTARSGEPDAQIAQDLRVPRDVLDQPAASLSGGERTRVLLARCLAPVRAGELVVLDEPTNHLDIAGIEVLETWIERYDGTVIVVAHDRAFLDTVATRVLEVARGTITGYRGNYTDYVERRDQEIERQRREHAKSAERLARAKAVIEQFKHQKRFDGQYASRVKVVERYVAAIDRTPDPVVRSLGFGLELESVDKFSNEVIRMLNISKAYQGTVVLDQVTFEVQKGDRIALVGGNGAGKSTLLKILTGAIHKDAGSVRIPPGVQALYLGQDHHDLKLTNTMLDEVRSARPLLDENAIKALVGRFRFNPDVDLPRKVETLSGGERARLALIKTILRPSNLLLLDEPTNHLDIDARQTVIGALNAYAGTLVVVSHDRFLLDSVTTKTAVLNEGKLAIFPGTFTETRHLHGAVTRPPPLVRRFRVTKKFTDWTTGERHLYDALLELTEEQLEASRSLRNAISIGWLVEED